MKYFMESKISEPWASVGVIKSSILILQTRNWCTEQGAYLFLLVKIHNYYQQLVDNTSSHSPLGQVRPIRGRF